MPIIDFPPINTADENGLLAIGGDYHPQSLLLAYSRGIFPWPIGEEYPLAWFTPNPRGIIPCDKIHIPRSLKKYIKKNDYQISFNQDFDTVILECAKTHAANDEGTWITQELIDGYRNFHREGYAYSVEVRNSDSELVGGLYGVNIGGFISGESMFHKEKNTSKIALLMLLINLKKISVQYLDTQMVTPVTANLGAKEIDRELFAKSLSPLILQERIDFQSFDTSMDIILNF